MKKSTGRSSKRYRKPTLHHPPFYIKCIMCERVVLHQCSWCTGLGWVSTPNADQLIPRLRRKRMMAEYRRTGRRHGR